MISYRLSAHVYSWTRLTWLIFSNEYKSVNRKIMQIESGLRCPLTRVSIVSHFGTRAPRLQKQYWNHRASASETGPGMASSTAHLCVEIHSFVVQYWKFVSDFWRGFGWTCVFWPYETLQVSNLYLEHQLWALRSITVRWSRGKSQRPLHPHAVCEHVPAFPHDSRVATEGTMLEIYFKGVNSVASALRVVFRVFSWSHSSIP